MVLSFLLAGTAAFLSGLAYIEYVVETPLTGEWQLTVHSSFSYVCLTGAGRWCLQLHAFDLWGAGCLVR